ncbi:YncE family protein [Bacillus massilinigeriensis]|uniref:YncE family protein n=1 Tax=Bacillus mediterraneensis TaxID=1805474 RepID=UPI0008F7E6CB|nr:WD40 repeat domain-containing protein [Bacillus mediterraneensis]
MKPLLTLVILILTVLTGGCSSRDFASVKYSSSVISTVNIKDMTVTFIDVNKGKKIADWKVDKPYNGGIFLPDGDTLLLYGKSLKEVDLFSLKKGKKIQSWNTGKGFVDALLIDGKKGIVFSNDSNNSLDFYTYKGKKEKSITLSASPFTLLQSKDGSKLFTISFHGSMLHIINLQQGEYIKSVPIHSAAAGAILNEEKNEIWIGGHGEGSIMEKTIHVYKIDSGELTRQINAPEMPVNFSYFSHHFFVLSHGSSMLYKFNGNGKRLGSLRIGANPFEVETVGDMLVVAGYDSDDVYLVDPEGLEIYKRIKVGKGPFQIIKGENMP